MAMSDPLGDMLTRIRNAQNEGHKIVKCPSSKFRASVLDVLERQGYIRGYKVVKDDAGHPSLNIELKYAEGQPVIQKLKRVSSPGRRDYKKVESLTPYRNGLGIKIVSTSRGLMTDHEARQANVGGEVLCEVF